MSVVVYFSGAAQIILRESAGAGQDLLTTLLAVTRAAGENLQWRNLRSVRQEGGGSALCTYTKTQNP
jgi:hypothetical protein